jgi:hypothetical protein
LRQFICLGCPPSQIENYYQPFLFFWSKSNNVFLFKYEIQTIFIFDLTLIIGLYWVGQEFHAFTQIVIGQFKDLLMSTPKYSLFFKRDNKRDKRFLVNMDAHIIIMYLKKLFDVLKCMKPLRNCFIVRWKRVPQ